MRLFDGHLAEFRTGQHSFNGNPYHAPQFTWEIEKSYGKRKYDMVMYGSNVEDPIIYRL